MATKKKKTVSRIMATLAPNKQILLMDSSNYTDWMYANSSYCEAQLCAEMQENLNSPKGKEYTVWQKVGTITLNTKPTLSFKKK